MNNFEKIKNMDVSELAEFIDSLDSVYPACNVKYCEKAKEDGSFSDCRNGDCKKATEKWLMSEAE